MNVPQASFECRCGVRFAGPTETVRWFVEDHRGQCPPPRPQMCGALRQWSYARGSGIGWCPRTEGLCPYPNSTAVGGTCRVDEEAES